MKSTEGALNLLFLETNVLPGASCLTGCGGSPSDEMASNPAARFGSKWLLIGVVSKWAISTLFKTQFDHHWHSWLPGQQHEWLSSATHETLHIRCFILCHVPRKSQRVLALLACSKAQRRSRVSFSTNPFRNNGILKSVNLRESLGETIIVFRASNYVDLMGFTHSIICHWPEPEEGRGGGRNIFDPTKAKYGLAERNMKHTWKPPWLWGADSLVGPFLRLPLVFLKRISGFSDFQLVIQWFF